MSTRNAATLLSPTYSTFFGMGRVLLIVDAWVSKNNEPLPFERAILIDFAVQNPRTIIGLVSGLAPVVRAHGLERADVADIFANRRLENARERLRTTLTDLVARRLVAEVPPSPTVEVSSFTPTPEGARVARSFQGSYAAALRDLAETVSTAWHRRSVRDLVPLIRKSIPDQSLLAVQLSESFGDWMAGSE
jgi:hypothetical protein